MCSRRRKAPSVPVSLQRSASASNRRFSLPENWRRLPIATTSGSRRAPSPEAISPLALPAPSATASEEEPDNPFREDFTNEVMFMSTCTLNCPRQVSHLTLARGARGHLSSSFRDGLGTRQSIQRRFHQRGHVHVYLYSKLPETGVSPHIGTGGAERMSWRTALALWLPRLSMTTMSPGFNVGRRTLST